MFRIWIGDASNCALLVFGQHPPPFSADLVRELVFLFSFFPEQRSPRKEGGGAPPLGGDLLDLFSSQVLIRPLVWKSFALPSPSRYLSQ